MALTHVVTSSPAFNQTSVTPTIPSGAAGDHAFLWATAKQWTKDFDPATFGGWTLIRSLHVPDVLPSGQGNGTAGQGQVRVGLFYQKVPAEGLAATSIGLIGSGSAATTLASGTISIFRSSTGADLDLANAVGFDVTTVTAFNYSADSNLGFTTGDLALFFSALSDDGPGWNTISATAPGVTFSALTKLADAGSALGDDTRIGVFAGSVDSGTSTGVANLAGTNTAGAGSYGGTIFLRVREVAGGGTPPVPSASGGGSWSFTGTAHGSRPSRASAVGSWSYSGVASGKRISKAAGFGTWNYAGSGTGKRIPKASGYGTWHYSGSVTGKRTARASGYGTWQYLGTATGAAPVIGQKRGLGTGSWDFTGTANGKRSAKGAGSGIYAWQGTGIGRRTSRATAIGTWQYQGTAVGSTASSVLPSHTHGTAVLMGDGINTAVLTVPVSTATLSSDGTSTVSLLDSAGIATLHTT